MRFLQISLIILLFCLPVCFSWSYETHRNICEAVYDNIPLDKESLLQGCTYPDELGDFVNHVCHQDYCPAYGRSDNYFKIGRNYYIENKIADASFNFGVACHYISDSMQPQHTKKSAGDEHTWFEDIIVKNITIGTAPDFFDAVNESLTYVDDISNFYKKDDKTSAYTVAEKFAAYAADLCYVMITNEMSNTTKVNIPDCSTIKTILKNDCDLMNVKIRGTYTNPIHRTSSAGNKYIIFYLSDGRNRVKVFVWGDSGINEGSGVIVDGIFYKERVVSGYTFKDEIEALSVKEDSLNPLMIIFIIFIVLVIIATVYIKVK
jgi:hypothetical protein